jgi:hypothetical protein
MAFVTSLANQGVSTLRFVGADGVQAPPEVVTDGFANPLLGLGARGDAIVLWYDSEKRLWARYRPVGGVLGPQEQVAIGVDRFNESNAVALDAAGTATVVWSPERRDDRGGLRIATRSEGGIWSTPQAIAASGVYASELAVTDNGSALLAWRRRRTAKRPNLNQVAVSTRPPGGTFGPPVVVAGIGRNPEEAVVAANDRGDAVVGWNEDEKDETTQFGAATSFYARFRAPGGRFGSPVKINKTKDMAGRWVTVTPEGRMVIGTTNNFTRRAEVRVRSATGVLGPATIVTNDLEVNSDLFPLPYGRGLIAWADRDPGVSTIRIAQANDDLTLGPPHIITRVHGWSIGPTFATSPQGGLVTVPRTPLRTDDPIRWQRVALQP